MLNSPEELSSVSVWVVGPQLHARLQAPQHERLRTLQRVAPRHHVVAGLLVEQLLDAGVSGNIINLLFKIN